MLNVFVSYSRENKLMAASLAEDIRELGHDAWFDQELTGGQAWWQEILATVRRCDVFVFVLTPESLNSVACMRECGYAAALRKPILPILISDQISTTLLPPQLAQIQIVDYRQPAPRGAALRLARALAALPCAGPLADPLPPEPEVPTSYLGGLSEQISGPAVLSFDQQSGLLLDLKRGLGDPETTQDSRELLKRLRKRRDLLATIASEIDWLLASAKTIPDSSVLQQRLPESSGPPTSEAETELRPPGQFPASMETAPPPPAPARAAFQTAPLVVAERSTPRWLVPLAIAGVLLLGLLAIRSLKSPGPPVQTAGSVTSEAVNSAASTARSAANAAGDAATRAETQLAAMPKTEYHARHILVATEPFALKIIERLNKGEKFEALAKSESMDSFSKNNGGDLGWFFPGRMVPEFAGAVMALQPGEYTHVPVQTAYGWHVIQLLETRERAPLGD
jgi:parvulin-like peptidyl-prolyl isomerase